MEDVHWRTRFDLLSLDEALQALAGEDERVSEVLQMRFFGGYEFGEIAEKLQVSLSTIERDAAYGLSWLRNSSRRRAMDEHPTRSGTAQGAVPCGRRSVARPAPQVPG